MDTATVCDTTTCQGVTMLVIRPHPDDESSATGGMLAHYHERGVRTGVVVCTGGEEGEIRDPDLARHHGVLLQCLEPFSIVWTVRTDFGVRQHGSRTPWQRTVHPRATHSRVAVCYQSCDSFGNNTVVWGVY